MLKKLLILTALLVSGPAFAATKPSDMVNVLFFAMDPNDPAIEKENKVYSKPFNQLKLDAKTKKMIQVYNHELDLSGGGFEKYRLTWIRIVNDDVQGFVFSGNLSSTWVIEPPNVGNPQTRYMHVGLDGNAGPACREGKPSQD